MFNAYYRQPAPVTLAFVGAEPSLLTNSFRLPAQGAAAWTGLAPSLFAQFYRQPAQAPAAWTGLAPVAIRTANVVSQPAQGTVVATGLAPTYDRQDHHYVAPGYAGLTISAQLPAAGLSWWAMPAAASASFSGKAPSPLEESVRYGMRGLVLEPLGAGGNERVGFYSTVLMEAGGFGSVLALTVQPGVAALTMTGEAPAGTSTNAGGFFSIVLMEAGGTGSAESAYLFPNVAPLRFTGLAPSADVGTFNVLVPDQTPPVAWFVDPGYSALYYSTPFRQNFDFITNYTFAIPDRAALLAVGQAPTVILAVQDAILVPDSTTPVSWFADPGWAAVYAYLPTRSVGLDWRVIEPAAAQLAITGLAPEVVKNYLVSIPSVAAVSFTGLQPVAQAGAVTQPSQGSAAFSGLALSLFTEFYRQPDRAVLSFDGLAPTLTQPRAHLREPVQAELTISGQLTSAIVSVPGSVAFVPDAAQLRVDGLAPALFFEFYRQPGNAALSFSGMAPVAIHGSMAYPGAAVALVTGLAPTLLTEHVVQPAQAVLTFSGADVASSADFSVRPAQAELYVTGEAADSVISAVVTPDSYSLTVTGLVSDLQWSNVAIPDSAALLFDGPAPGYIHEDHHYVSPGCAELVITCGDVAGVEDQPQAPGYAELTITGHGPQIVVAEPKHAKKPPKRIHAALHADAAHRHGGAMGHRHSTDSPKRRPN